MLLCRNEDIRHHRCAQEMEAAVVSLFIKSSQIRKRGAMAQLSPALNVPFHTVPSLRLIQFTR